MIVANAVTLGLETWPAAMRATGGLLSSLDRIFLTIFVIELAIKIWAHGWRFFTNAWNVFDFVIVGIALVPATGPLSVLRAFRVLRVLRLVSAIPRMRFIVEALLAAMPGIASIAALLSLIFYVFAVMATKLFGPAFPDWFGSLGESLVTLFQIMTLDGWPNVISPVMEVHPWAWAFFIAFILASTFIILNLFIAVIVDTMQNLHDRGMDGVDAGPVEGPEDEAGDDPAAAERAQLLAELRETRERLDRITTALERGR
ncbi:ion transporter [Ornithinimicrobium sp. Y1694]|uniref:ion transporter n=1 Tax=Ornithinimicrobium sp. Y1694 TaxID=3418590 RepID=UPI003CEF9376